MTHGSLIKPITDYATRAFAARCASLGLWAWSRRDGALAIHEPEQDPLALAWVQTPVVSEAIARAADQSFKTNKPAEVGPGLYVCWLADEDGPHADVAFLALGADKPDNGLIDAGCREAGLDPQSVRQVIHQLPRRTPEAVTALMQSLQFTLADLRRIDRDCFAMEDLTDQLGQSYENITLMYRMGRSMSTLDAPRLIAESICNQLRETQGFGWVITRFHDHEDGVPELSGTCMVAGELPCSADAIHKATGSLIESWKNDTWSKLLQVGRHELADLVRSEVIVDPIYHDGRVIGAVMAGGKTGPDPEATSGDTQLVDAIAGFLGAFHENAARFNEQRKMFIGTLEAVSTALDAKDRYTFGHSERVAMLATQLSEAIGLDPVEIERIHISGLVHDVGKIGVPEAVLCKPGRLTDEEFEQIKRHPRIGYNILKGIPKMADVLDGVLYHHERWDGRGYPDRLAGEAIPLYGRILAVADTFDAMSSTRSYRNAMPREKVLAEIARCAGSQFDPTLTGPFVAMDFTVYDEMVQRHQGMKVPDDAGQAAA